MAITAVGPTGTVDQAGFSRLLDLGDGMVGSLPGSSNLRVDRVVGQDRRVSVQPGDAEVPGIRANSNTAVTVDLPANAAGAPRLDWVVQRFNWGASPATITFTSVQGTAAANPIAPALYQVPGDRWDLGLGLVTVAAGVGALPADAVRDARYWRVGALALVADRGAGYVDPPHRRGREMFVLASKSLYVSDGTTWVPVNVTLTSGAITPSNGWENYGGAQLPAGFVASSDGSVQLRGMLRRSAEAGPLTVDDSGDQVGTVPVGRRPAATATFAVTTRIGTMRLDVQANGAMILYRMEGAAVFPGSTGFVALDGCSWYV